MLRWTFSDWALFCALAVGGALAVACLVTAKDPREGLPCCFEQLDHVCWRYGTLERMPDASGLACVYR